MIFKEHAFQRGFVKERVINHSGPIIPHAIKLFIFDVPNETKKEWLNTIGKHLRNVQMPIRKDIMVGFSLEEYLEFIIKSWLENERELNTRVQRILNRNNRKDKFNKLPVIKKNLELDNLYKKCYNFIDSLCELLGEETEIENQDVMDCYNLI